jgi:hypothetical protein
MEGTWQLYGKHAITITGYGIGNNTNQRHPFIAHQINQLYVHDDQRAPFAQVEYFSFDKYDKTRKEILNNRENIHPIVKKIHFIFL